MIDQLREIQGLCLKHEDYVCASLCDRLIELHGQDHEHFWDLLTSNEVWGGAGSLADQCLLNSSLPESEVKQDRRVVWRALVKIAREMTSARRVNVRTESWASTFRSWLRKGI